MKAPGDFSRASRLAKLSPLGPGKAEISPSPPPPSQDPEESYGPALVHEPGHGLRDFLYKTLLLPVVGLSSFSPVPEAPAPPGQMVQTAPGGVRKATESQRLDELVRAHLSGLGDPEHALQMENLTRAIETVAEIPEKVSDEEDAIRSVIDAYVALERKRGKGEEDIAEGLKKIREWQKLATT